NSSPEVRTPADFRRAPDRRSIADFGHRRLDTPSGCRKTFSKRPKGKVKSERTALLVLLATLLATDVAPAQIPSPTGGIYGTALDPEGKFVTGVGVMLAGPAASQKATTDSKGDFHFLHLAPGLYSIMLERTGFEMVRRDVDVAAGRNAVISIPMTV